MSKLPYEEFKRVYSRVPRLCVDLLFVEEAGVLLIERLIEPGKGLWHFPGGTVLMGESLEATLARVAKEETGLTIYNSELCGYLQFNEPGNAFFHTVSMLFRINAYEGTLKGGEQGENIMFHKRIPSKIIAEHKTAIVNMKLLQDDFS